MMSHLKFSSSSLVVLLSLSALLVSSQQFNIINPDSKILQPPQETSKVPRLPPDTLQSYTPNPKQGFVTTKNGHFYLNDQLFDFRSLNAPTLVPIPSVYEVTDTSRSIAGFGSPVTRSYTLGVADDLWGGNQPADHAHISGWDPIKNDWIYPEISWQRLDKMLAIAAEEGIKMIFPIINQDYGSSATDFVGNMVDLIRHRYNISSYSEAQLEVDWFVDRSIRDDFKKIIHFMLTRKNTVNGKIYGEDDTFLAFETGNEMNWGEIVNITYSNNSTNSTLPTSMSGNSTNSTLPTNGTASFQLLHRRPAPADWTIDIAKYIKSLAPNILVMDGSYARNMNITEAWPEESLRSEYIDIFSYHFYGDGDLDYIPACQARVESFGKTFVVGEHGFYSNVSSWKRFYDTFKGAGALIWSLREHSEVSGFKTHAEGNNIFSLHVPGFKNQTSKLFDQSEYEIIELTYQASFDVLNKPRARYPIPGPPHPFFATNSTSTGISFKGSAWADHYEIWGAEDGGTFVKVGDNVYDNVESGQLLVAIDPSQPKEPLYVPPLTYIDEVVPQTGYTDSKWFSDMIYVDFDLHFLQHRKRSLSSLPPRQNLPHRSIGRRAGPMQGGWFCVRGISKDGTPGVFSHPVYISASDEV